MSFTTHFQHIQTTELPLPPLKTGQSYNEVAQLGLKTALSLLQNHDFMMELAPFHQRHEEIPASDDRAIDVERFACEYNVLLKDEDDVPQRVNGGKEWRHYEVHDQVPIAFGYKKDVTFQTAIRNTDTGMESLSDPGSTVTLHGRYDVSVSKEDPAMLILVERQTTHCTLVLGWYVKSNLASSHADIHKTIKAKFVESMQK